MKYKVELLSCLTYKDKNDPNKLNTRLGYRMLDPNLKQDTDKFKGYAELSYFSDGTDLFNRMKKEYFGIEAEITTEERPSNSNPLRKVTILKSIRVKDELINLL